MKVMIALLALVLIGCGKSEAQTECEAREGNWESQFSHFLPVVSGKTTIMVAQYRYYCDWPN